MAMGSSTLHYKILTALVNLEGNFLYVLTSIKKQVLVNDKAGCEQLS
jgi:hypothetical protein